MKEDDGHHWLSQRALLLGLAVLGVSQVDSDVIISHTAIV